MSLILSKEPLTINAGDTVAFYATVDLTKFPLGGTWTVTADVVGSAVSINDVTATESDNKYLVTLTATQTATLSEGNYTLIVTVSSGSDRYTTYKAGLAVKADIAAATTLDTRSHARITLDAIEAVIEGRATKDQEKYTIKDRSLDRTPLSDLLMFRDRYKAEVAREERAERIKQGLGHSGKILVRFT